MYFIVASIEKPYFKVSVQWIIPTVFFVWNMTTVEALKAG